MRKTEDLGEDHIIARLNEWPPEPQHIFDPFYQCGERPLPWGDTLALTSIAVCVAGALIWVLLPSW